VGPKRAVSSFEGVKKGLDWVVEKKDELNIRVANFSIGMPLKQPGAAVETLLDPLGSSIRQAVEAGIVIVAAAGNFGPNPDSVVDSPAVSPDVITVGGYDARNGQVLSVSSRGDGAGGKPDLLSFAAPIVSGVVAAMFELNPALTPAQIKEILRATARPIPGVPSADQGAGVLQAGEALRLAAEYREKEGLS
jgi:serine protease AprX